MSAAIPEGAIPEGAEGSVMVRIPFPVTAWLPSPVMARLDRAITLSIVLMRMVRSNRTMTGVNQAPSFSPITLLRRDAQRLRGGTAAFQFLGDQEREFQGLFRVQPRVAEGFVTLRQIGLGQMPRTAGALGHVLAGHFDVDTAGPGVLGLMDVEEAVDFAEDFVEIPGLQ